MDRNKLYAIISICVTVLLIANFYNRDIHRYSFHKLSESGRQCAILDTKKGTVYLLKVGVERDVGETETYLSGETYKVILH